MEYGIEKAFCSADLFMANQHIETAEQILAT